MTTNCSEVAPLIGPLQLHVDSFLDRLHASIQDQFNDSGIQIMSPNYRADPADKKIVPKDQWFT